MVQRLFNLYVGPELFSPFLGGFVFFRILTRVVDLPAGPSRFNQVEEKFSDVLATMVSRDEAKDEFRRKGGDE